MKKIRVWIYIRVSTKEQAENGHWKDLQLAKIKKFIEYNFDKWYIFSEDLIYKDLGISWAKDDSNRPWLKKLKQDIKDKKIDAVVIYKLDRLARKTKILLELVDYFNMFNIPFISTIESIDTSSTTWKFFITILGAIWEMERDLLAEKWQEGIIAGLKKWIYTVWWNVAYWFERDSKIEMKLKIVKEEAKIVKYIFDLYVKERKSLNEISQILENKKILPKYDLTWKTRTNKKNYWKWSPTTISRMLSNKAYIWLLTLNKTEYVDNVKENNNWVIVNNKRRWKKDKDKHIILEIDNIIEAEIFHKAQELLVSNIFRNNNKNKAKIDHLFSSFIKCGICWSRYKWDKWKPNKDWIYKYYYRCWKTNKTKHWEDRCNNSQIRESELIENIYTEINRYFKNPKLIIKKYIEKSKDKENNKKYSKEVTLNTKLIDENLQNVEWLFDSLIKETNSTFKEIIERKINDIRKSIENLEKRNDELKKYITNNNQILEEKNSFEKYIQEYKWKKIEDFSLKEQKIILEKILKEIIINRDNVNVVLLFKDDEDFSKNEDIKKPEPNHNWLNSGCSIINGGSSGARTQDLILKRDLLYQLS